MMQRKHLILLAFVLLSSQLLFAQKAILRQAEKNYAAHNFLKASQLWQKAFEQTSDPIQKQDLAFRIATSYHRMNMIEPALQWYADAIGTAENKPEWLLSQADAFLRAGNLAAARDATNKALKLEPYSAEAKRTLLFIQNFESSKLLTHPKLFEANTLNTTSSDYAAAWFNNDLILSSSRFQGKTIQKDGRTSENFSSLYLSVENLYGDFGQAILLPVDGNKNAGVMTFDSLTQRIFFTKCTNRKQKCSILESKFDAETFYFSRPVTAGFVQKKHHYGHPHMSENGKLMYFSATLPGGYGGNDIYSISLKADGSWGLPVNAGPNVNTAFDEVFPTTIGDSILLFSSAGQPEGYGGLDIYAVKSNGSGYSDLQLLLPPFNSTADDFSLSMRKGTTKGVISSSRKVSTNDDLYFFNAYPLRKLIGGVVATLVDSTRIEAAKVIWKETNGEEITTTTTIDGAFIFSVPEYASGLLTASHPDYHLEQLRILNKPASESHLNEWILLQNKSYSINIKGKVTERDTQMPMEGEALTLSGPGAYVAMTKTDMNGRYSFESLQPDRIYTVRISGEGFFTESRVVRTPEVDMDMVLEKSNGYDLDFELTRITEKKEIVLNDIYYDFDKSELRESSKIELQKLASMLRETPGVNIQISSHTDERGTDSYNNKLSLDRAQSVVDYLIASGISSSRLLAKGYGKSNPIFRNAQNEDQHQTNRRTTFQVVDYDSKVASSDISSNTETSTIKLNSRLIFRVQVLVSSKKHDPDLYFAALKNVVPNLSFYIQEQGAIYRYEAGDRYTLSEAEALRTMIRLAGFNDSFIVPYIDQQRVTIQQAKDFIP